MEGLSIGQLAAKANVNASTLRYYESIGLLPFPERRNGQRRYDESLLERIHFIKVAQHTGFNMQEIAILLTGYETGDPQSEQWEQLVKQKRCELENKTKQIELMIEVLDNCIGRKCINWSECMRKIQTTGTCC
ncbi:MerR family transcriptional regulator [Paenibacillus sp. OV219]|uniref:helix-turn-helix domain-containing protein n=1 Tax=Paenibacillus sp. OV219 TaxID=1884377 RepID=UPI0008BDC750|nr:MerR family transcriptional regulator [Paenibacillus sp. OV219]SEO76087.1 MerR family transcriptional regulator, redox-sensitive transcriptional activator SoxR [Paenibacillus sp. OV219]